MSVHPASRRVDAIVHHLCPNATAAVDRVRVASSTAAPYRSPLRDSGTIVARPLTGNFSSASTVSTGRACDLCKRHIHAITWLQCGVCMKFDLCGACAGESPRSKSCTFDHDGSHHLSPITYAQSQDAAHLKALEAGRERRLKEMVDGDGKMSEISGSRDIFLLERALNKESAAITSLPLTAPTGSDLPLSRQQKMCNKLLTHIQLESMKSPVKILSIGGGGVRGILSIRVLRRLMHQVFDGSKDAAEMEKQRQFVRRFHYVAGTSTGGLIGFCLAADLSLGEVEQIYLNAKRFFKPSSGKQSTWTDWASDKALSVATRANPDDSFHMDRAQYDPSEIHRQIDTFVTRAFKHLASPPREPTIADLHQLLNPKDRNGNRINPCPRALVINTFEAATSKVRMIDSSSNESADFRLKDVLKGTMAAPLFFPPHTPKHTFLDGGLFANDPMLAALHCARRNHRIASDFSQYRLVGVGTGITEDSLKDIDQSPPHGGINTWMLGETKGLLVNTVLEANRSLTETITEGLAHFQRIRRFKFNLRMKKAAGLNDFNFIRELKKSWPEIEKCDDMQALEQFLRHQLK